MTTTDQINAFLGPLMGHPAYQLVLLGIGAAIGGAICAAFGKGIVEALAGAGDERKTARIKAMGKKMILIGLAAATAGLAWFALA